MHSDAAIFSILPESHHLLATQQFAALDNWLSQACAERAEQLFARHRPLQNLVGSGHAFLAEMQQWQQTCPTSPNAQVVLGATFSYWASEFRGSGTYINENNELKASLCADLAARHLLHHMIQQQSTVFVCGELISLMNHVGMPNWFYHPSCKANDTLKQDITEQLPALGDIAVPAIPDPSACAWFNPPILDEKQLLQLARQQAKDDYYIYSGWQHYLRPRWGGSVEDMLAVAEGSLTEALTPDQRAVLKLTALTDELDDMDADELDGLNEQDINRAIATFNDLTAHTAGPLSEAYLLGQRGLFFFKLDETQGVADCFLAAVNTSDFALAELADDVEQLFIIYPHEPAVSKLAQAAFWQHSVKGAAILSLCYHFGLGGLPPKPELAAAIADHVGRYHYGVEEWANTANDIAVRHPSYAEFLLQQGVERNFVGAHAELADMLLCDIEVPQDIERARQIAEAGAALGHVDALAVQYLIQADEDDLDDEQRIAVLKKLAELGLTGKQAVNEEILEKAVSRMDDHPECDAYAYQLTQHAYQHSYPWAAGHLAFHLYFGRGTARNRTEALWLAEEALEEDAHDSAALRVQRAQRYPFMYRILRPKKETLYDSWQFWRRVKPGVDVP